MTERGAIVLAQTLADNERLRAEVAALREDRKRFMRMAEDWSNSYIGLLVMWKGAAHVERLMDDPVEFKNFNETREAIDAARKGER